ncbi:hypothetical protein Gogos_004300 [Gossypium gossypioides]|uniref:Uncharacterized protein n=1 Tax=Gossypium gossypioides TaxID=34282 RepID=A0A7J9CGF5_GOSGO|nr:hypothetical protein [Gossypium gossypioides]
MTMPTLGNLKLRRLREDALCPICKEEKIVAHLFRECTFTKLVLQDVGVACLQAAIFTEDLGFKEVSVEGDVLTVIKKLIPVENDRSVIGNIIKEKRTEFLDLEGYLFGMYLRRRTKRCMQWKREDTEEVTEKNVVTPKESIDQPNIDELKPFMIKLTFLKRFVKSKEEEEEILETFDKVEMKIGDKVLKEEVKDDIIMQDDSYLVAYTY